jgi:LPXTG-motif cell wall-anchored protein
MGASLLGNMASILFAQDEFIGSPLFFVLGGALVLGLGGLLFYLRNKESDE